MPAAYWRASVYYGPGRNFWIRKQEFTGADAEDNARTWLETAIEFPWTFTLEAPHEHAGAEVSIPKSNINYTRLQFFEAEE